MSLVHLIHIAVNVCIKDKFYKSGINSLYNEYFFKL